MNHAFIVAITSDCLRGRGPQIDESTISRDTKETIKTIYMYKSIGKPRPKKIGKKQTNQNEKQNSKQNKNPSAG